MGSSIRQELKIGNIVGYSLPFYEGVPLIIKSMYNTGVILKRIGARDGDFEINCHNLGIVPIPLTIHRLKKFQFMSVGSQFIHGGCIVTPISDTEFKIKVGLIETKISSVHKLQNIFFKETGIELPMPSK